MSKNIIINNNSNNNNFASIKMYNKELLDIYVYSAFEVDQKTVLEIAKAVAKKYNFTIKNTFFNIDESLIAGIKVVFDSNVIDNTLKAKLNTLELNTKSKL